MLAEAKDPKRELLKIVDAQCKHEHTDEDKTFITGCVSFLLVFCNGFLHAKLNNSRSSNVYIEQKTW
jgi:hypothetical protein